MRESSSADFIEMEDDIDGKNEGRNAIRPHRLCESEVGIILLYIQVRIYLRIS